MDFDPVSGKLGDTDNGSDSGDEINIVNPGFYRGWNRIQRIFQDRSVSNTGKTGGRATQRLGDFGGKEV